MKNVHRCEACGSATRVIETRETPTGSIRRRRACIGCRARTTTYEIEGDHAGQYHRCPDAMTLSALESRLVLFLRSELSQETWPEDELT